MSGLYRMSKNECVGTCAQTNFTLKKFDFELILNNVYLNVIASMRSQKTCHQRNCVFL